MRLALLSDIHGNLPALHAVLQDIERRGVDRIVNLGDSLSGPLLPRETAALLMQQPWLQLAGNHERQLLHFDPAGSESDRYAHATLDDSVFAWLARLPGSARIEGEVLLCHGTVRSDCEDLLETFDAQGSRLATPAEIDARLEGCELAGVTLLACGHTHVPRAVRSAGGTLLVNPGSVGLQAFSSQHPRPHWVQTGAPHARYAVVERRSGWHVELHSVPYDHGSAAALARAHGRPDWAHALETGCALPDP